MPKQTKRTPGTLSIYVSPNLVLQLAEISQVEQRSLSQVARILIEEALAARGKKGA